MQKRFILFFFLLIGAELYGQQNTASGVFKVNPLMDTTDQLRKIAYKFPAFKTGYAVFKDGTTAQSRFNYNLLLHELLFITPAGDTLALNNAERYRYILIDSDTIYFTPKGAFWLVQRAGEVSLLKRDLLRYLGSEKKGAYDGYSGGASITSVGTLANQDNVVTKLNVDENSFYALDSSFYLMNRYQEVLPATKKSFYNVFAKKEKMVRQYLQEHPVDFHKEKDLDDLLHYLQEK